jgi:type II secretion system (T2SS) protein M
MNVSARDRKIILVIVPVLVLVGYWFLLLSPKRDEAAKAGTELAKQEQRRDQAKTAAENAEATKATFAADYTQLVKLGKAIPAQLDMPTVMVQLESAAQGTGVSFSRIAAGERAPAPASPAPAAPGAPQPPAAPGSGDGSQPAAPGGQQAGSAPGGAVESAGDAVNGANANTTAGAQAASGAAPAPTAGGAAGAATAAGLESVPIELDFEGHFFHLADFFHRVKRFVHVADRNIRVGGRLLSIESLTFKSEPEIFPRLKAELKATVYLSPAAEGETAGASPQGPAQPVPAAGSAPASPTPAPAPTAAATP